MYCIPRHCFPTEVQTKGNSNGLLWFYDWSQGITTIRWDCKPRAQFIFRFQRLVKTKKLFFCFFFHLELHSSLDNHINHYRVLRAFFHKVHNGRLFRQQVPSKTVFKPPTISWMAVRGKMIHPDLQLTPAYKVSCESHLWLGLRGIMGYCRVSPWHSASNWPFVLITDPTFTRPPPVLGKLL